MEFYIDAGVEGLVDGPDAALAPSKQRGFATHDDGLISR